MSGQELFEILDELREAQQKAHSEYEAENDAWWNGLTEEEREDAFYAVCKRIHKADLVDRGTYRHTLYDVFGFDMNMYGRGMECRYMEIHNALSDGGNGVCLCNQCGVVLSYGFDHRDVERYCDECYEKLFRFVKYIATDYVELSHDKVRVQRDDYIRMAKKLLQELENE